MTADSPDPAASALQPIRDRAGIVAKLGPPRPGDDLAGAAHRSAADVPRLLKAVEAALRHHEPMPTYAPAEHADGSPACGHDTDRASHFEGDTGEMLCGESPGQPVCAWCEDNLLDPGEAEWPCPVYADITAELTENDSAPAGAVKEDGEP